MTGKNGTRSENQSKTETSALDEAEIIKRILKGEKDLYALIVRKYNQRLYRVGMSIINNETEVQDVMQSTYINAYENLDQFKFQSHFSTWLTRILVNESLQNLKKREKANEKKEDLPLINPPIIDQETPLGKVLNSELRTILESSIRGLPENYRMVFIMREIETMTVAETKEILGLTEANVKVRLNRAKVMLRNMLGSYLKEDELLKFYEPNCDKMVNTVMEKIINAAREPF